MPCKAKNKPATNAMPTYKPFATTERFLATMDQNRHVASKFTTQELMKIGGFHWTEIRDDLFKMNFTEVDTSTQDNSAAIEKELSPVEDLTNAIAAFGQWFEDNNIIDSECPSLINNIRHLAMMFSLIPAPHHCPPPPPCTHPHQDDALPCQCLHTNDIPPPLPCVHPHHDDEDTPMEPSTPTHAFSEATSQTPAPSHEASTPPLSPTAVATLLAAVASPTPAGLHGQPSYAGAAARNLNPAFFIELPSIPQDTSLPSLVSMANKSLMHAKLTLKVDSASFSLRGIMCATATIPSTSNLNIIKATLSGGLLGVCICIPASQSFIKIVDVPFLKPGTTEPFTSTEVDTQLQCSIIPLDYVVHWHYICNSPKADSATIWINLSDLQQGTHASQLISC
ncbi:hypothetical protein P691DRAFT_784440 [Macrolepiota fuliginosa MF-IS2]|uniref:Uncharacterized protein n=1 Tax=Macrolepiota fuliginosa MF-IS2 TaxID=1400762 RepID=A0A9P5WY52_9AGAR|nr:hypothetical protein P691DRAFT_784440 [Macrolepiota fuliginosa MF-IS2]